MFNQNQFIMKKLFTLFAAMVTVVALNAQTVDYEMAGFVDNQTDQNPITELTLSMTDNFSPVAVVINNGPDAPASADTIYFDITIEGQYLGASYLLGSMVADVPVGQAFLLYGDSPLLTASQMDQIGFEGTLQFCYTVRIAGATTDPVSNNNQACLTVTRGTTDIEEVAEGEVNVYPNPATTVINIDNAEGAQISVYDLSGRMVSSVNSASANQTIDASNLAKGMYIVRIANGNNVITKKVNVVR